MIEDFLIDIWRLGVITGSGRPDAMLLWCDKNQHLMSCLERHLVRHSVAVVEGKLWVSGSIWCGHGEEATVEYALDKELWILKGSALDVTQVCSPLGSPAEETRGAPWNWNTGSCTPTELAEQRR